MLLTDDVFVLESWTFTAGWCNGSTNGSEPFSRGSNPCPASWAVFRILHSLEYRRNVLTLLTLRQNLKFAF